MNPAALTLSVLVLAPVAGGAQPVDMEFFEKKIRPVLAIECYECHSQKKAKGGLALDSREGLLRGGDSGPALNPADPAKSLLVRSLQHADPEMKMPQNGAKLDENIIADIISWIQGGMPDPRETPDHFDRGKDNVWPMLLAQRKQWWSLQPVQTFAPPDPGEGDGSKHPVDRFLTTRLKQEGLASSRLAEPLARLRRLSFVLTGLPPDEEDLTSFQKDPSPQNWARLVDKHLASPHFGERWARHWMDLMRYSETHGSEQDAYIPHAWRYRDYLVRAFNSDLPYDRLVQEHLAGDLIPVPRKDPVTGINESLLGTVWFHFVEFYHTPVDVKNEEVAVMDSRIDAFGKAFLGLTIACARCHDHKFDAVSQRDFQALYSVFASTRTTVRQLDDPAILHAQDKALRALRDQMREPLAEAWLTQIRLWNTVLPKAKASATLQGPWPEPHDEQQRELQRWIGALQVPFRTGTLPPDSGNYELVADFRNGMPRGWFNPDEAFQQAETGEFRVEAAGNRILQGLALPGVHSGMLSDKHGGALRSPNFTITRRWLSALVSGTGDARLRLVVENFQGDSVLFAPVMPRLNDDSLKWMTLPMRDQWLGRRAYLELVTRDEMPYRGSVTDASRLRQDGRSRASIQYVVAHVYDAKAPAWTEPVTAALGSGVPKELKEFAEQAKEAVWAWRERRVSEAQAALLDALIRSEVLEVRMDRLPPISGLAAAYRELENTIPIPQRAPGVSDEGGVDEPFFARGNHLQPGPPVPRAFVEALDGDAPFSSQGSGRLELARHVTRADNPLVARLLVNRLWHHVYGAGLVRTVDNFGRLGEKPSHPELLDWLAGEFVREGWSVKSMLRLMVTSRAFQLSTNAPSETSAKDPGNRLLSHAPVRRRDAESIRDAFLAASGRLESHLYGAPVPAWQAAERTEQSFPKSGPLDGGGRRSLYLEVRRNFLSTFLQVFDLPRPTTTTGVRNQTTVPAQSLALLNDPFVQGEALRLARRALALRATPEETLDKMHWWTFQRPATEDELSESLHWMRAQAVLLGVPEDAALADEKVWRDCAHLMFNRKEFLYLR